MAELKTFDYEHARKSGASDLEISQFLASEIGFDLESALEQSKPSEVAQFLTDRYNDKKYIDPVQQQTIDDMGAVHRGMVGFGKGFRDIYDSVEQLGAHALPVAPETQQKIDRNVNEQEKAFDRLSDQSTAATAGNITGSIAAALPTMAVPGGQTLPTRMGVNALVGAAESFLAPVRTDSPDAGSFSELKAEQATIGGLIGAGFPAAIDVIRGAPVRRVLQGIAEKASKTPEAIEGVVFNQEVSGQLTPAAITGNRSLAMAENWARQMLFSADKIAKRDEKFMKTAQARVQTFIDSFGADELSKEAVGMRVQEATKKAVTGLVNDRDMMAKSDYGLVRELAGPKPFMPFENVKQELHNILRENEGVATADAAILRDEALKTLKTLPEQLDINAALQNRSGWSRASRGASNVFQDLHPSINRVIGARLSAAAERDFQQVSDKMLEVAQGAANQDEALAVALKSANDNYKAMSQSIDFIENTVLGRTLGKDIVDAAQTGEIANTINGETVFNKLMRVSPGEAATAMEILGRKVPGVQREVQAAMIREALEKGQNVGLTDSAAGVIFNFARFIKALPDHRHLKAFGLTRDKMSELQRIVGALTRQSDRTGYNFSGTDVRNETRTLIEGFKGLATGALGAAINLGGTMITLNSLTKAMTEPEGLEILKRLATPHERTKDFERLMTIMTASDANQDL